MGYNELISGFAAFFILILCVYCKDYIRSSQIKDRLFNILLYIVLFGSVIEIVNNYIEKYSLFNSGIFFCLKNIYYIVNCTVAYVLFIYRFMYFCEVTDKVKAFAKKSIIPYAIIVSLFIINIFTRFMFNTDNYVEVGVNSLFYLYYIYLAIYPIYSIVGGIINKETISVEEGSIITLFVIDLIAYFVFEKYYHIDSFYILNTMMIYIVYLYLQNNRLTVDYVTRLSNRKLFINKLSTHIGSQKEISIILVSLDDFKLLNDTIGHKRGDVVLRLISEYLLNICPTKEVYRYGGDEYAIILENESRILTKYIVENTINRFKKGWEIDKEIINISTSIGVVQCPKQATNLEEVISLLEHIISKSKNNGKGKAIYCDDNIKDEVERKNKIIEILNSEINKDGFEVFYQPIFDKRKGKFTKAEALLRLNDSEIGPIYPNEFIPIAEEVGLITEIGYMVLDKTCKFIKKLNELDIYIESISINYSPIQLKKETLVERTMSIIEKYGVDPSNICIEITENFMVEGRDKVVEKMEQLHKKGIKFYLDDFGTGYSNISRVMKLPFDVIKIDKTLIENCEEDNKCFHLLEGLTAAFEKSNMKVLVEGVETENQIKRIGGLCYYIQGFYYARPVCEEEAIKYFDKKLKLEKLALDK